MKLYIDNGVVKLDYHCSDCLTDSDADILRNATSILASVEYGEFDTESCTIFELPDKSVGVFDEWSDYTGHG